jgi:parvulin-like peptidyl-prolyl isomerase
MRVRHILVEQRFEAEDLLRKLESLQGQALEARFQELAQRYSQCSSGRKGGDLGDLSRDLHRLDERFRDALIALKIGELSTPVRSNFGHHLILRID